MLAMVHSGLRALPDLSAEAADNHRPEFAPRGAVEKEVTRVVEVHQHSGQRVEKHPPGHKETVFRVLVEPDGDDLGKVVGQCGQQKCERDGQQHHGDSHVAGLTG